MPYSLEYHKTVNHLLRRLIPASLASFAVLLFPLFTVSSSPAQIGGVSPEAIHSVPVAPPTAVRVRASNRDARTASQPAQLPSIAAFATFGFRASHRHSASAPPAADTRKFPAPARQRCCSLSLSLPGPLRRRCQRPRYCRPRTTTTPNLKQVATVGDPRNYSADAYVRPLPVDPSY